MGGKCPSRKAKKRNYSHKTACSFRFLIKDCDAVCEELQKPEMEKTLSLNEDLPGMGQYYCLHCDRYFAMSVTVRDEHLKIKRHKKPVKQMMGPAPHAT
ncbi:hypothetical protein MANES_08G011000v8 [Manihot esculenta]|uniref:Uncharacterized protein n=1 Tax=Manihot esculenta TaxID=3983 RepID=A0ACB7H7U0_MANES|nr:hypothetical protein MANES_08G011000v8 [Manihot esculenta]